MSGGIYNFFRNRLARTSWRVMAGGAWTVLLGLLLLRTELGQGLSFDLLSLFLPPTRCDEVVVVTMDERAHGELGQTYGEIWDRTLHAQLINKLKEDQAKLVVLDIWLGDDAGTPEADRQLAEALRAHGRCVLAAIRVPVHVPGLSGEQTLRPTNWLAAGGNTDWGIAMVDRSRDSAVRRHYPGTELDPSLAWTAARLMGAPVTKDPEARRQERWLRCYRGEGSIALISYAVALKKPPGYFRDKSVFVGGTPTTRFVGEEVDEFRTPFTSWTGVYSGGVEIQATEYLNLLRGDWLERMSPWQEVLLVVGWGLLLGCGLNLVGPRARLGAALLGILAAAGLACLLLRQEQVWFHWLNLAAAQVPLALLGAVAMNTFVPRLRVAADMEDSPVPDHLLRRRLRRGVYGEVWLAQSTVGDYHLVKIVDRLSFERADAYEREYEGLQKYRPVSRSHQSLLQVLQVGRNEERGHFFCLLEAPDDKDAGRNINPNLYQPKNLAVEISRRGRIPPKECLRLGLRLAAALDRLHQQGFVHRNISPASIVYVKGAPKLSEAESMTKGGKSRFGSSVGQEGYTPPEGPESPAADLYSLGMVLYAASTGLGPERYPQPPSEASSPSNIEVLNDLNRIIATACHPDATCRYSSAADLRADLLIALDQALEPLKQAVETGISIGDHMLIQQIGRGAYGEVWMGRNQVGIYRAVKIVFRDRFGQADPYEREFQGVRNFMGVSMSHPGFLKIFHVGRDDQAGFFFYVMEAGDDEVSGQRIDPNNYKAKSVASEIKRRGALPPEECLSLLLDLTAALEELHRLKLIHRDLKPSNIIYVDGVAKLADIGLVATMSATGRMTSLGTPAYMAPEGPGAPTSDIYSLGKVLYVALTNGRPESFPELPTVMVETPSSPLAEGLVRIMLKACSLEVHRRYASAADMRADLMQLQRQTTTVI